MLEFLFASDTSDFAQYGVIMVFSGIILSVVLVSLLWKRIKKK
ncbi:MAG: hypothetical protein ACK5KR_01400 [Breznakia sp.]